MKEKVSTAKGTKYHEGFPGYLFPSWDFVFFLVKIFKPDHHA
jgi:hypothetical protein